MVRFVRRRLLMAVFTVLGVTFIASGLVHLSGDPVAVMFAGTAISPDRWDAMRREFGLDKPFILQYVDFLKGAAVGDLGYSVRMGQAGGSALSLVLDRLPATAQLTLLALVLAVAIGVPAGIIAAVRRNSVVDFLVRFIALLGQSIPSFWMGLLLILFFSVGLRWLPSAGRLDANSIILPAFTLSLYPLARITRILRASLLETLGQDYIRTAHGKGLPEVWIVLRHALKNASLPVLTVIALQLGGLMGGTVVVETIFAWPGVGSLAVESIGTRDFPVVRAIVVVGAIIFITINLLTDVLYAYLNPRIRYS